MTVKPSTAIQINQLNHLLDILEEVNDHAKSIDIDSSNVNIRGHLLDAIALVNLVLGRISASHIRALHKAQISGTS